MGGERGIEKDSVFMVGKLQWVGFVRDPAVVRATPRRPFPGPRLKTQDGDCLSERDS